MTTEQTSLVIWGCNTFKPGCFLGDLAREILENETEATEDDWTFLECAYEGWAAAGGGSL